MKLCIKSEGSVDYPVVFSKRMLLGYKFFQQYYGYRYHNPEDQKSINFIWIKKGRLTFGEYLQLSEKIKKEFNFPKEEIICKK